MSNAKYTMKSAVIFPDDVAKIAKQERAVMGETVRLPVSYGDNLVSMRLAEPWAKQAAAAKEAAEKAAAEQAAAEKAAAEKEAAEQAAAENAAAEQEAAEKSGAEKASD